MAAKRCFKAGVFILVQLSITAGLAMARPPRVIKATPDNGEQDVDPRLREIRVVFDQDMQRGGYSVVGGGDTYPKTIGKPRWMNKRTFVMRVKLVANHEYRLSINNQRFKNFRSMRGEPAEPYPIRFRTGSDGGSKPAERLNHSQAAEELCRAIQENYSYYDLRKLDWNRLFTTYQPRMKRAKTSQEFTRAASELLAHAQDMHIWLEADGKSVYPYKRNIERNYNRQTLSTMVPGWRKRSAAVYTGRFNDGIGYILIDSWSRQHTEALEQVYVAIWEFSGAPALIIDVRPNGGGAEPLAMEIAGCFLDEPAMYAKHVYRSADLPGGFSEVNKRIVQPNKRRPKYRGNIAVLMGQANMSSCEAFLLMMKQVPNCKLVGQASYGSSGNPKPINLGNEVTIFLPSWKAMRPDGTCFEAEGIAPDITVKTKPTELIQRDPVLEAALTLLRKP